MAVEEVVEVPTEEPEELLEAVDVAGTATVLTVVITQARPTRLAGGLQGAKRTFTLESAGLFTETTAGPALCSLTTRCGSLESAWLETDW